MALLEREIQSLTTDKTEIQRIVDEQYKLMGIEFDPTATAEMAQKMVVECLKAHGIGPEENIFSRGIIAARYER
jgi:hypothetical protein